MKASKTERDIAFAVYDGVAAAEAIILLTEAIHGANTEMIVRSLNSEAATLYEYGRDPRQQRASHRIDHIAAEIVRCGFVG
jgi:hypothetical protein